MGEHMPGSYEFFNSVVANFIDKINPKCVLDVGTGKGKYGQMLKKEGRTIDDRGFPRLYKTVRHR